MPAKLPETEGRRHAMGFRTTLETRTLIEEAAHQSGRSVSQEIEARLEHSFAMDRFEEKRRNNPMAQAVDKDTEEMCEVIKVAAGAASMYSGDSWKSDIYTRASVRAAAIAVISNYFTKFPIDTGPETVDFTRVKQADEIGSFMGKMVSASRHSPETAEWINAMAAKARGETEDKGGADIATLKILLGRDF